MRNTTNTRVITVLKAWFSTHGIPVTIIVTLDSPSTSEDFKVFIAEWDFHHVTSSPYHPQSNGHAENAVKTCIIVADKNTSWRTWPLAGVTWMAQHSIYGHECVSLSATVWSANTHPSPNYQVVARTDEVKKAETEVILWPALPWTSYIVWRRHCKNAFSW